jgi:hypothetical protein
MSSAVFWRHHLAAHRATGFMPRTTRVACSSSDPPRRWASALEEIAELLRLRSEPGTTCAAVRARAEAKMADIDQKIAALGAMKGALAGIAASCADGEASSTDCPILAALDAQGGHT